MNTGMSLIPTYFFMPRRCSHPHLLPQRKARLQTQLLLGIVIRTTNQLSTFLLLCFRYDAFLLELGDMYLFTHGQQSVSFGSEVCFGRCRKLGVLQLEYDTQRDVGEIL